MLAKQSRNLYRYGLSGSNRKSPLDISTYRHERYQQNKDFPQQFQRNSRIAIENGSKCMERLEMHK